MDFANKMILAPMVRVSTVPMRLSALEYGADIVYSEEIVDLGIMNCRRVENDLLGTVDFVGSSSNEIPVFRTFPTVEKSKLVFQMGTNSADKAVAVGKLVESDVAAVDVNMGCPKPFSVHSGMGAALLSQPDNVKQMLTALVSSLSVPVTCKVRLLDTLEESLEFCQMVERCGVSALTVHGRRKDERPQHSNRNSEIREISRSLNIPVIANGGSKEIKDWKDIEVFKEETGCSSVMLARAAQWNPSIFRKDGRLPLDQVIPEYLKKAVDFQNTPQNTKYVVQRMLGEEQSTTERGQQLLAAVTLRQICKIWDLDDYYAKVCSRYRDRQNRSEIVDSPSIGTDPSILSDSDIIEMEIAVPKKKFTHCSPKNILQLWCKKQKLKPPHFESVGRNRKFRSVVVVDGNKYSSSYWERNKKFSEQASSMVCLQSLGLKHLLTDDFWDEYYRPK